MQRVWSAKPKSANLETSGSMPIQPENKNTRASVGTTTAIELYQNPQQQMHQGRVMPNQYVNPAHGAFPYPQNQGRPMNQNSSSGQAMILASDKEPTKFSKTGWKGSNSIKPRGSKIKPGEFGI